MRAAAYHCRLPSPLFAPISGLSVGGGASETNCSPCVMMQQPPTGTLLTGVQGDNYASRGPVPGEEGSGLFTREAGVKHFK